MQVHKFEAAGLGKAPFRVLGVCEKRGPIKVGERDGVEVWSGSPGQPMGSCDFCGTGIAECWEIGSADGRRFIVGCECVRKTGDAGLKRGMAPHLRALRHAREQERIDAFRARVASDTVLRDKLAALPHPRGFTDRATGRPLTRLDEVEWMLANAGAAGSLRTIRSVEKQKEIA